MGEWLAPSSFAPLWMHFIEPLIFRVRGGVSCFSRDAAGTNCQSLCLQRTSLMLWNDLQRAFNWPCSTESQTLPESPIFVPCRAERSFNLKTTSAKDRSMQSMEELTQQQILGQILGLPPELLLKPQFLQQENGSIRPERLLPCCGVSRSSCRKSGAPASSSGSSGGF